RMKNKVKDENLSGMLNVNAYVQGPFKQLEALKGNAAFSIHEGFLGKLIPAYNDAYFTDAQADFIIENKRLRTDNAILISKIVQLKAQGWIDFDQTINFDISPQISELAIAQGETSKINPSNFLAPILNIKATGTLTNPAFSIKTGPVKVLQKTSDILMDNMGTILEEIFK
ncbi:MAG: hypothetical protein Q7S13_02560, partial [Candidatus Omnitrophota bacterium]|nr:hypothetical protein [Candidatus Omnitrophota bacterium]